MSHRIHYDELALWASRIWMPTLALGLLGWWAIMVFVPSSRPHFLPEQMGDAALWAFILPDVFLVGLPTLYAWRLLGHNREQARWTAWLVTGALGYSALWSLGASLWTWSAPAGPIVMLAAAFIQAVAAWTLQPEERWFREATHSSVLAGSVKTLADALLFTGAFLVVIPILLRLLEDTYGIPRVDIVTPWVPSLVTIVLLNLIGLGSGLWMVRKGDGTPLPVDTAATLVVSGPYAWIRNPMAAVGIAQGVVLGLALGSPLTVVYALFGGVFWHGFVRPIEERDLRRRFGEPYLVYERAVPLWRPRLAPWRPTP